MEQADFRNIQDIRFSNYLSDLESLKADDLNNIDILLNKFPYCQLLYLLAVKAAVNTPQYQTKLAQAATIIPSRNVLYDIIHHPEKFSQAETNVNENIEILKTASEDEALISIIDEEQDQEELHQSEFINKEEISVEEEQENDQEVTKELNQLEPKTEQSSYDHDDEVFDEITPLVSPEITLQAESEINDEKEILDLDSNKFSETILEESNETAVNEETGGVKEQEAEENNINTQEQDNEEIESGVASFEIIEEVKSQEIGDELPSSRIASNYIENIGDAEPSESLAENYSDSEEAKEPEQAESIAQREEIFESSEESLNPEEALEEKPESKTEEPSSTTNLDLDPGSEIQQPAEHPQQQALTIASNKQVSAYNDERLPYTFLWWLAKTRNDHENTRPYATFKLDTTQEIKSNDLDALNHQIAENIFHFQSPDDIAKSAHSYTVPFDFRKKEHQIIEKFIKEEPQIKPPAATKIDTENKAKKSSEDTQELVSETLAKVYVEQMLFHKALEVYKKLSLKYPEKSAYFASQIKYLELKVN